MWRRIPNTIHQRDSELSETRVRQLRPHGADLSRVGGAWTGVRLREARGWLSTPTSARSHRPLRPSVPRSATLVPPSRNFFAQPKYKERQYGCIKFKYSKGALWSLCTLIKKQLAPSSPGPEAILLGAEHAAAPEDAAPVDDQIKPAPTAELGITAGWRSAGSHLRWQRQDI
ncbi:hypothetical protein EYF80_009727 [Liparis tanakae]|uniref:Uncharacterized protein n=1 Tax=Liparis tanakae TaxID=230148 RepID=A0A4Z2IQ87_9TELE|nr:hypothetical protein EYF80_009727 [Liparis tanakae]